MLRLIALLSILLIGPASAFNNTFLGDDAEFHPLSAGSIASPLVLTATTPRIDLVENDATPKTFNLLVSGSIFGIRDNLAFPGIIQIDGTNNDRVEISHPAAVNDFASVSISRAATFSGGTNASINNALNVFTTVGASNGNVEWGLLTQMVDNGAAGNLALYAKNDRHGTGLDWAAVFEVDDFTSGGNPTAGIAAVEMDLWAQGTDTNGLRSVLTIETGNTNVGGAVPTVTNGIVLSANNGIATNGTFTRGLAFGGGTFTNLIAFETRISTPVVTNGIDFSAVTFSGFVFKSTGFQIDASGNLTANAYSQGANAGVDCLTGVTAGTVVVHKGIVTHC